MADQASTLHSNQNGSVMTGVLPPAFFFRFAIPVIHQTELPRTRGGLLQLPGTCRLPQVNLAEEVPRFGDLRMAWNNQGLGVSVEVRGKKMPVSSLADQPLASDGLQLWIDTRNTQSIHRATRYCHHFCFLPVENEKPSRPLAMELPIARAREERKLALPEDMQIQSKILSDGYRLEAWLPAKVLLGYDPEANPQLGFYYLLQDAELGREFLTVGEEFPFEQDPSLWSTLELVSE
jgi:hypothetical protein